MSVSAHTQPQAFYQTPVQMSLFSKAAILPLPSHVLATRFRPKCQCEQSDEIHGPLPRPCLRAKHLQIFAKLAQAAAQLHGAVLQLPWAFSPGSVLLGPRAPQRAVEFSNLRNALQLLTQALLHLSACWHGAKAEVEDSSACSGTQHPLCV